MIEAILQQVILKIKKNVYMFKEQNKIIFSVSRELKSMKRLRLERTGFKNVN